MKALDVFENKYPPKVRPFYHQAVCLVAQGELPPEGLESFIYSEAHKAFMEETAQMLQSIADLYATHSQYYCRIEADGSHTLLPPLVPLKVQNMIRRLEYMIRETAKAYGVSHNP